MQEANCTKSQAIAEKLIIQNGHVIKKVTYKKRSKISKFWHWGVLGDRFGIGG